MALSSRISATTASFFSKRVLWSCSKRSFSEQAAKASKKATSWQTYVLGSTVVVLGIPAAVGTGFVWNLKSDRAFRWHFEEKYPEFVEYIGQYIDLEETPEADDENDQEEGTQATSSYQKQVVAVITMATGRRFRVHLQSTAGMKEIHAKAVEHGASSSDTVVDVLFEDYIIPDAEDESDDDETKASSTPVILNTDEELPQSTWPETRPVRPSKKVPSEKRIEWDLSALRGREQALLEEKRTGYREIDVIDEDLAKIRSEIQAVEAHLSPKKSWWGIF